MDTKFQTSFIPKKPLNGAAVTKSVSGTSFFTVIAVVIFVLTALGAIGVFAYEQYLTSSINSMSTSLAAAQNSLNLSGVAQWVRLDKRIESAKTLLSTHLALSAFFDELSTMTLRNIRFKNFGYSYSSGGKIQISMDGSADSFATVALQSDEFAKNTAELGNQLFSNLDLSPDGGVTFRFSATLNPASVSYTSLISPNAPSGTQPSVQNTTNQNISDQIIVPPTESATTTPATTTTTPATKPAGKATASTTKP